MKFFFENNFKDCKKIFEGKTFDAHITCKSEAEQFHG